ncbi:hypothetical protein MNEG_2674 [Monoraphidium neglectum]|uniref:Uncharacterized protein n=1 Tax=Monoraphidium neglectum TaxID=145388 RepID=A0A0D2MRR0_9CHLO|nr:hypothetical protein MNEG_2674 [Monoraphidium neglectum]KIZ05285.1 hypothetical protein MNEG_2674 [Monoraphidium neglectum]|eukprot:XP_013904304.1 hypothetical protein MNEG_2674 [Monoraphidium neglectum]
MQDLQYATTLAELVYTRLPEGRHGEEVDALAASLGMERPLADVTLHSNAGQRYAVGHTPNTMYVAFMGTKSSADWGANLRWRHAALWDDKL